MSIATVEQKQVEQKQEPKNGSLYAPQADEDKAQFDLAVREANSLARSTRTPKHLIGRTP